MFAIRGDARVTSPGLIETFANRSDNAAMHVVSSFNLISVRNRRHRLMVEPYGCRRHLLGVSDDAGCRLRARRLLGRLTVSGCTQRVRALGLIVLDKIGSATSAVTKFLREPSGARARAREPSPTVWCRRGAPQPAQRGHEMLDYVIDIIGFAHTYAPLIAEWRAKFATHSQVIRNEA